jgi:predicted MFS family arabinose efflux permease
VATKIPPEIHAVASADWSLITKAVSLSFGAAIGLGIARFSYPLLLSPMKASLGWNFAQAGTLNTGNAMGYLLGALLFPLLARRITAGRLVLVGCVCATLLMATTGYTTGFTALLVQRSACGLFSALIFVGAGLLAARLATAHPSHSGLVLGLYYGGTGWGIAISALVVPWSLGGGPNGWQSSWIALAIACAVCSALVWPSSSKLTLVAETANVIDSTPPPRTGHMAPLLAGYLIFGIGYIGYETFVIALLRAGGMSSAVITTFYVMLGLATAASGKLWSGVLHRVQGGRVFALFGFLLSAATFIPALFHSPIAAFASGIVFGGTFLQVVAATTAFVQHNLPQARWSGGISLFTAMFALGQTVGPVVVGHISDRTGLSGGLICSAVILLVAAVVAAWQKPLIGSHS